MTLLVTDLKQNCDVCQGSGFVAGFHEYGSILPNASGKCSRCHGIGYHLTELGQEMLELFRPFLKEMIRQEFQQPARPKL
ncbi:MAG: hypothetical protein HQM12_12880 [SAR324 cluster bacterium]|nr:hypothetical protein [SAR324 cluster bacterium]MBF0350168.1 hypothetical protein [SAR324 cluster bacterium]